MPEIIPSTAICGDCGQQRGEHSCGSFQCPASQAHDGDRFHFTTNTFTHANG